MGEFNDLISSVNLGQSDLKLRWNKVSCNSVLCSKHQEIYMLRIKKNRLSKTIPSEKNSMY